MNLWPKSLTDEEEWEGIVHDESTVESSDMWETENRILSSGSAREGGPGSRKESVKVRDPS